MRRSCYVCGRRRRLSTLALLLFFACVTGWLVTAYVHFDTLGDSLQQHNYDAVDYLNTHKRVKEVDANPLLHANGRLPKEVVDMQSESNGHHEQQAPEPEQTPKASEQRPTSAATVETKNPPVNIEEGKKKENHTNAENMTLAAPINSEVIPRLPPPSQIGPDSLELLRQHVLKLNTQQRVLNSDKFPPLSPDGLVLVVQVHRREGYLKQLLESLRQAKGIENVLLVISHDYFYDEMNDLVQSIDFCRVSFP